MGLRPAKSHEKPSGHADWADGGADPLVRAGRPRPAAGPTISAPCRAPAGRRGRRPRTRGSAPPFPEGGFSTLSIRAKLGPHLAFRLLCVGPLPFDLAHYDDGEGQIPGFDGECPIVLAFLGDGWGGG